MKRFLFGVILTVVGLLYSGFCFLYAVTHPWTYNGIEGLYGSFLGTGTLVPFVISLCVMVLGLLICGVEAYRKK